MLAPSLGGLVTLGLAHRWGQVFPRWVPALGGRRVPRPLALVPGGIVATALTSYGLIGVTEMTRDMSRGATSWLSLGDNWAVVGTEVLFLVWGVTLGAATIGYHLVTRSRCAACAASAPPSARARITATAAR